MGVGLKEHISPGVAGSDFTAYLKPPGIEGGWAEGGQAAPQHSAALCCAVLLWLCRAGQGRGGRARCRCAGPQAAKEGAERREQLGKELRAPWPRLESFRCSCVTRLDSSSAGSLSHVPCLPLSAPAVPCCALLCLLCALCADVVGKVIAAESSYEHWSLFNRFILALQLLDAADSAGGWQQEREQQGEQRRVQQRGVQWEQQQQRRPAWLVLQRRLS